MIEKISENLIFEGRQLFFKHFSKSLKCETIFSIFLPKEVITEELPVLYWLSGLTCTADNFTHKSGFQHYAAKHKVIVVAPDTSPRGPKVKDIKDSWDIGCGAGFYLNATSEGWKENYQMYEYVINELPKIVQDNFQVSHLRSISGHSMGGHGALICSLKNPGLYASTSAFAPIVNPMNCPWGMKAFKTYLGEIKNGAQWDSVELIENGAIIKNLLIDQGTSDNFLEEQLMTSELINACKKNTINAKINMRQGYDHSYYFISTFIESHIEWHAKHLKN